jgi:8-amino-7-oxononanoate synthase
MRFLRNIERSSNVSNPFFRIHDGRAGATTSIDGRQVVNFGSYDYLGINGHPEVSRAAKEAIDRYGTTVSASRLISGERAIHRDLERKLAALHQAEDALAFPSGHATNVTVIGHLLGPADVIFCDARVHNSIHEGARLSGAKVFAFAHNDLGALRALRPERDRFQRAMIVVEGLYSMDGDMCDLAQLVAIKKEFRAWLMVDEAHSIGALGARGHGVAEEAGVDPVSVDIWMGTLSKALASAGGYIAGSNVLVDILRSSAPGFVFSVGLAPAQTAAASAALDVMLREPARVAQLRSNSILFRDLANRAGLNTLNAAGRAIIPVRLGDPVVTVRISELLLAKGFNAPPVIYPAVAIEEARLRFFVTASHTPEQICNVIDATVEAAAAFGVRHTPRAAKTGV